MCGKPGVGGEMLECLRRAIGSGRGAISGLAASVVLTTGCLADIRPEILATLDTDNPPSAAALSRGRLLLEGAANKHGLAAWKRYHTTSVRVTDNWYGTIARMLSPWPAADVRFDISFANGKSAVRAEFVQLEADEDSEQLAGLVWGVQNWKVYEQPKGGSAEFVDNNDIRFILPTVQYFISLPFRLIEAPIVVDAGSTTIAGTDYDRVLVTWDSVEANDEYDQYVVYIDKSTGLIDKVEYTVREIMSFITGTMHYGDFRNVGGVTVGFDQTVTSSPTDADPMHRMTLTDLAYDRTLTSSLYLNAEQGASKHP